MQTQLKREMREQKKKEEELKARQDDPKVAERKRKQEKAGRSKAERDKRSALKESDASSSGVEFPLAPIGTVASCFLDCAATPRQPGLPPPGSGLPLPHCARSGDGGPSLASSSSGDGVRSLAAGAGARWVERLGRTGEGGCC